MGPSPPPPPAPTSRPGQPFRARRQMTEREKWELRQSKKRQPVAADTPAFSKAPPEPEPAAIFHDEDDEFGSLVVTDATTLGNCAESVVILGELWEGWDIGTFQEKGGVE